MRNRDAGPKIRQFLPFKASNFYAADFLRQSPHGEQYVYAVFSFGAHWPLAFWSSATGWIVNEDRYPGTSTRRHQAIVDLALEGVNHRRAGKYDLLRIIGGRYPDEPEQSPPPPPTITRKQQELFV